MKRKNHLIVAMLFVTVFTLSACSQKGKTVDYTSVSNDTVSWGCDAKEISNALGQKADVTDTTDETNSASVYENCALGDYTGEMTYYFTEDKLALSKWQYRTENIDEAKTAYESLKKLLTEENGDGTETETKDACQWSLEDKNITLNYSDLEDGAQVCVIEYQ